MSLTPHITIRDADGTKLVTGRCITESFDAGKCIFLPATFPAAKLQSHIAKHRFSGLELWVDVGPFKGKHRINHAEQNRASESWSLVLGEKFAD